MGLVIAGASAKEQLPVGASHATGLSFAKKGALVVDATRGRAAFPEPTSVRHFKDMAELAAFAAHVLNAVAVKDKTGAVVGVRGMLVQRGTPYYATKDKKLHVVRDAILELLGGPTRTLYIGSRAFHFPLTAKEGSASQVALDSRRVIIANGDPPSDISQCSGSFCVHDSSFINNWFFYKSIGGETDVTSGGFQTSSHFCWKWGFIPWSCSSSSGHDSISISNRFFVSSSQVLTDTGTGSDTSSLTVKEWAFGSVLGIVGDLTGVCSTHASSGTGASVPVTSLTEKATGASC